MAIRKVMTAALLSIMFTGCASTSGHDTRKTSVSLKTYIEKGCERKPDRHKFNARCDVPVLGYSGFTTF